MLVKPLFFSKHVRLVKAVKSLYFMQLHAAIIRGLIHTAQVDKLNMEYL